MSDTISVRINEKKLVSNLGHAFSNTKTVLSELMQNSRRAKATYVKFSYEGTRTLTVEDDGIGISNFADLLHVAESGWDEETKKVEKAFGMGWLSCLFTAKHVAVISNGKKVEFDTESAIAMESIKVETTDDATKGTKIVLSGFSMVGTSIETALVGFAKGFPIDVFFNKNLLPRPHALENLSDVIQLKDMQAYINTRRLSDPISDRRFISTDVVAYLQGLEIYDSSKHDRGERDFILHLDSEAYVARMPDRDCLIDAESHAKHFHQVARDLVKNYLESEKARLTSDEFVLYWNLAYRFDLEDIFNDVPVLPKSLLLRPTERPLAIRSYDDDSNNFDVCATNVSRADVESGKIVLCKMDDFSTENTNAASWVMAAELGWVHVNETLSEDHWAFDYIKLFADFEEGDAFNDDRLEVVEVEVEPHGIFGKGSFSHGWITMNEVVFCSSYRIQTADGKYSVINADTATSTMINGKFVVVVPAGDMNPGWIVEQHNDYESDDTFFETQRDDDEHAFNGYAAAIRGEAPEETLKNVLINSNARCFPNLIGKKLLVEMQADGSISVMTH